MGEGIQGAADHRAGSQGSRLRPVQQQPRGVSPQFARVFPSTLKPPSQSYNPRPYMDRSHTGGRTPELHRLLVWEKTKRLQHYHRRHVHSAADGGRELIFLVAKRSTTLAFHADTSWQKAGIPGFPWLCGARRYDPRSIIQQIWSPCTLAGSCKCLHICPLPGCHSQLVSLTTINLG